MNEKLGPIDYEPCPRCGRRHHRYAWPEKCLEELTRREYAADLAYDQKAYAEMSQVERDAHDNL